MMSCGKNTVRATVSAASLGASSSSSSSGDEILYGTLREENHQQRGDRRQNKTWNCPRKTIKAVDSMGRIEKRLNVIEDSKSSRKSKAPNKCKKRVQNLRLKRYNRLVELAKPKSIVSNKIDDSITSFEAGKFKFSPPKRQGLLKFSLDNIAKKSTAPTVNLGRRVISIEMKQSQIAYRTSEHIAKLAEPRVRDEIGKRIPGKVHESALSATASKRLLELAKPKICSTRSNLLQGTGTARKTASGVSREALRAVCSPRITELATPRKMETMD